MNRSWLIAIAIAAAAVLWLASGQLFPREPLVEDGVAHGNGKPPLPAVRVGLFEAESMNEVLSVAARTRGRRTVQVRAEVGGRVEDIGFREGEPANRGQLLVRLAEEDRRALLAEARALVAQREAELDAAERLGQRDLGPATELAQARAALAAARAREVLAALNVQRLEVEAPFAGILDEQYVEIGDMVDRGDPLAMLVELDPLRVRANVSERYMGRVRNGMTGTVRFAGEHEVEGEIVYVGARADERTRTFPIELEVSNPDGRIIEEVAAQVHLPLEQRTAHRLPASVLGLSDDGVLGVKVVDEHDRVVFLSVTVAGDGDGGLWLQGLPERVRLITVGHEFVRAGQKVRPVDDARRRNESSR